MTDQTVMTLRFQSVFFCSHGSKRRISAFALWSEQNSFFIPLVTTKTWLELEPMLVLSRTLVSLEKQNSFVCTNSCQFGYQNHFWGAGLYKASRNRTIARWWHLTTTTRIQFGFALLLCQSRWGLKNNSLNLHKKTTNSRILVVVVKWRHRAIVLLKQAYNPGGGYSFI